MNASTDRPPEITADLVARLIRGQFPQWAKLSVTAVDPGGHDNRSFRLGQGMLVRLPSAAEYAAAVEREQRWLPVLSPALSQPIPLPIALGLPGCGFPWKWSVYRWLDGTAARPERISSLERFARDLAVFLRSLQAVSPAGGPSPGPDTFHRGGALAVYDGQLRRAVEILAARLGRQSRIAIDKRWTRAVESKPPARPVWVHGDIAVGNLLVGDGRLCGVIDFGQFCVGDPACDLAIAWTLFDARTRPIFRSVIEPDDGLWVRAQAWALWKALIVAAGLTESHAWESAQCWSTIHGVLGESGQTAG